jgi:adenylosuccinate lyase
VNQILSGVPALECQHDRGHITDSAFYGHRYATEASRRIFCDRCRYQRWLDVEAALAVAQAELGVIPQSAAEGIKQSARVELLDLAAVRGEIRNTGHSLVGLLRVFQSVCPGKTGEYVHYGATTQDIQDTGQSLEMRDVLDELDQLLVALVGRLADLAERHAADVALGRTHAQPALPIGFGLKLASWLDELLRHTQRLAEMRPRVLVVQMFGGVGTMAGFGDQATPTLRRCAELLGLAVPAIGWHVARDRVAEYVTTLAMIAGTAGRIADEVRILSRPEFGEVEERWQHGKVASSTMPHKRNPEGCEQAVVMARLTAGLVGPALQAMSGDNERDSRALRIEWACVPDVSHYTLAGCQIVHEVLSGLTVHTGRLLANVSAVRDQLASENLMLRLGEHIGKQTAHERVYELSQQARDQRRDLRELLEASNDLAGLLSAAELDAIFDPTAYLGSSELLTQQVVLDARKWLGQVNGASRTLAAGNR